MSDQTKRWRVPVEYELELPSSMSAEEATEKAAEVIADAFEDFDPERRFDAMIWAKGAEQVARKT